ncbi:IscS subfamily cysteine desulfurase [Geomicrobium sp. JCM 19039]|uniref:IscS subfamily cysteine desulfurase n=1 Tax=Geomicrobium sp. JCM 19039 TaxID=1460636 RepID=UPI00045F12EC|nr:IscS subfamily cysteine desulfurase [Geomicrobium sp. JCM 19039]GAK14349.1 cysteine desulfurase [Geomicrobium sp. JCM 19039]
MIYLDYSATTPMSDTCLRVYNDVSQAAFGNTNSVHTRGLEATDVYRVAKQRFAHCLNIKADGVHFTGSGSEANFLSIVTLAKAARKRGNHILSVKTEHPSVLDTLDYLSGQGYEVTFVDVDGEGNIDPAQVEKAIRRETILATFAVASSEIGTVQKVDELSELLRSRDILFHSDAVQAVGRVDVNWQLFDAISMSAHKLYAPKGVGVAYIAPHVPWQTFYSRSSFRPGTVDVAGAAAFAVGIEEAIEQLPKVEQLALWRDEAMGRLTTNGRFSLVGAKQRLPFHLGFLVHGWSGQQFMLECDRQGIQIAVGSACRAGQTNTPESLLAIGLKQHEAEQFIRVTFGVPTTRADVEKMITTFEQISEENDVTKKIISK